MHLTHQNKAQHKRLFEVYLSLQLFNVKTGLKVPAHIQGSAMSLHWAAVGRAGVGLWASSTPSSAITRSLCSSAEHSSPYTAALDKVQGWQGPGLLLGTVATQDHRM